MSTTLQLAIVAMLIAAAAVYIGRSMWKSWSGKAATGCAAGCGKCAQAPETETMKDGRFPLPQA